jgi:adenylate kinase family enzyme
LKRILVIGSGGSGKTRFAQRLAARTGLPLIHLDALYWRPGWDPTPADEWRTRIEGLVRGEHWIMDGNYGGTLDLRLEACDTVVFLDRSRWVCLWRVVQRQLQNRRESRPEMAPGCPERLTWEFVQWIWTYRARRRPAILARLDALQSRKQVYVLHSAREVDAFLNAR